MWHSFVNNIPVVGHVKGLVHYGLGDVEEGNRAMKESTRSTAVIGAGAVGFAGGPLCAATLASCAGSLWDGAESIVTKKPTGVVAGIDNIVETVSSGEVPVKGVLQTTLCFGGDALGGLGGAGIASSVTKSVGKAVGQTMAKEITKTVVINEAEAVLLSAAARSQVNRSQQKPSKRSPSSSGKPPPAGQRSSGSSGNQSSGSSGNHSSGSSGNHSSGSSGNQSSGPSGNQSSGPSSSGNGQQPPEENPRTPTSQPQEESFWEEFLSYFGVSTLNEISIRGQFIFKDLDIKQKKRLRQIIKILMEKGILESTLTETLNTLSTVDLNDITFDKVLRILKQFGCCRELLLTLDARSLVEIRIRGQEIFTGLEEGQENYLYRILKRLIKMGVLRKTIETMVNLFNRVTLEEVNFANFLSLAEFIMVFVGEHAARTYQSDVEQLTIVGIEITRYNYTIVRVFNEIKAQIERITLPIQFRDIFAAVYHYYKHRIVGEVELSVEEYYDLIRENLRIIMEDDRFKNRYAEFENHEGNSTLVFTRYYPNFGRRVVIIVKIHEGRVILSSCYFDDEESPPDEDMELRID